MAVSLPSDLVADVMRNADPMRRTAAAARLQSLGNGGAAFAAAVDASQPLRASVATHVAAQGLEARQSHGVTRAAEGKSATYRGFEQMVLRNLFESLLPAEDSGTFGSGPSAGVWRSMAADQLATVYADKDGLGIARMLASAQPGSATPGFAPQHAAQWPYFSLHPLRGPGSSGQT